MNSKFIWVSICGCKLNIHCIYKSIIRCICFSEWFLSGSWTGICSKSQIITKTWIFIILNRHCTLLICTNPSVCCQHWCCQCFECFVIQIIVFIRFRYCKYCRKLRSVMCSYSKFTCERKVFITAVLTPSQKFIAFICSRSQSHHIVHIYCFFSSSCFSYISTSHCIVAWFYCNCLFRKSFLFKSTYLQIRYSNINCRFTCR